MSKKYQRRDNFFRILWPIQTTLAILLFESICLLLVLSYPASQPNYTSYRKCYFYKFVANVLHNNMGIIISYLRVCRGSQRQKTSYLDGTLTQCPFHPTAPILITKASIKNEISYDFQPPFSLHISNSRTKPAGVDFFYIYSQSGRVLILEDQYFSC